MKLLEEKQMLVTQVKETENLRNRDEKYAEDRDFCLSNKAKWKY